MWRNDRLDWDELLTRSGSPARVAERVKVAPASFMAFDVLGVAGVDVRREPWTVRRELLDTMAGQWRPPLQSVPFTLDYDEAARWFSDYRAAGVEGLVVKGRSTLYKSGRRDWLKVKTRDTVEAVVGAVTGSLTRPDTLVVGRYQPQQRLVIIGETSRLTAAQADELAAALTPPPPGTQHPWPAELRGHFSAGPVKITRVQPDVVVEIAADTARSGHRYRHSVRYLRRRPDLGPADV